MWISNTTAVLLRNIQSPRPGQEGSISIWYWSAVEPNAAPRSVAKINQPMFAALPPQPVANITMDLIRIYQCFCDRTRLRILHLLTRSPLSVSLLQNILAEPQVKISKHLA